MPKEIIRTDNAPKPAGPYSQGVMADKFLFCAGQVGTDPKTGTLAEGVAAQTKQTLTNMKGILEAAGLGLENVVRVGVYLVNIGDFAEMNKVYQTFFSQNPPARSTIQAPLVGKNLIEIDCVAYRG